MNGNITKEGITLDLEAMSHAGLGGFQLFEAGISIPKGTVTYLSQQWLDMLGHTVSECKRLGLEFAMHNCPGWSSSGGPWITPALAMQQLTWSETTVSGNKHFRGVLAEPVKRLNYYQDAAVIAFPALAGEEAPWASLLKTININGQPIDLELISADGRFKSAIKLGQPNQDNTLDLHFYTPYQIRSLTMLVSGNSKFTLQYAKDGNNFVTLHELYGESFGASNSTYPDLVSVSFPETAATNYRLLFRGVISISVLSLSGADRLGHWLSKTNAAGAKNQQGLVSNNPPASAINLSKVIDLTAKMSASGELDWDIPPGEWTVLRMGHTAIGRLNHSAPATGTGLDCDKFSAAAFDFHWKHVFEKILPLLQLGEGGKAGLLIDSYEMGLQNWTAGFPTEFEKRKKYDITPYLPALTGRIVGDSDTTERFLQDFRRVQADLMSDNYYSRFARLCKANGIISYTEPYEGGNFEEMQIGRSVDICMGEFWAGNTVIWNNSVLDRTVKLAASVAHSKGQLIVGAEAYTAEPGSGKWQQYPFAMKGLGDLMFTRGLTRMIFHRYAHQPHPTAVPGMTMGPWGIHFDRTNTWFPKSKEWIKYVTRCQLMLRKGTFVADAAYFTGEEVPGRTIDPQNSVYRLPAGYDYDLINTECLVNECSVKNGVLENRYGVGYKVLIIPGIRIISIPVLRQLNEMVKNGLTLIAPPPAQSPGITNQPAEKEFNKLVSEIWGTDKSRKGRVFQNADISVILREIGIDPDFTYTAASADAAINFIHRKENGRDIYFVANRRRRREKIVCSFRLTGKTPELWDAVTGQTTPALFFSIKNGRTLLPLELGPSGSVFVVFQPNSHAPGYEGLQLNGRSVISTAMFPQQPRILYNETSGSFTVSCWAKPETDIALAEEEFFGDRRTDNFAVHPVAGEKYYGKGHAGSGFTIGRNGIVLFERKNDFIDAVLFIAIPISGWSNIAVVYHKNVPSVYLNGQLVKTGAKSAHTVHPSVGESYQDEHASYYNGEITDLKVTGQALTTTELPTSTNVLPLPDFSQTASLVFGKRQLCIWKNGIYTLKPTAGKTWQFKIDFLPAIKAINTAWMVRFQENRGAPEKITMDSLLPLQKHEDPGVRYFSGTAEYLTEFSFTIPTFAHQINLNLGRVEVIADVSLNGVTFPVLWCQPYSLDVTQAIRSGINKLSVKVTNLWPNRLIGDENLPVENEYSTPNGSGKFEMAGAGGIRKLPEWYINGKPKPPGGRTTFSTWKHYTQNSPLLESGLAGPVTLSVGVLKDL